MVPFVSQLTVRLVLKEWQFSDGSISLNNSINSTTQLPSYSSQYLPTRTGRKLKVTVIEGRDLASKDKSGNCDPYVKLHYGKVGFCLDGL